MYASQETPRDFKQESRASKAFSPAPIVRSSLHQETCCISFLLSKNLSVKTKSWHLLKSLMMGV